MKIIFFIFLFNSKEITINLIKTYHLNFILSHIIIIIVVILLQIFIFILDYF